MFFIEFRIAELRGASKIDKPIDMVYVQRPK